MFVYVVRLGVLLVAMMAVVGCGGDATGAGAGGGGSGSGGDGGTSGTGGGQVCESALLCGSPAVCCDVGEECFEGACVAPCPSGVRCGNDGSVCCDAGDVCLASQCATPGADCIDSFDCPEGEFCEPTLGQCLPQPEGELCELRPENLTFEPTIEWHWDGWSMDPDFKQVQTTPAIADIDGDGLPEVATVAYKDSSNNMLIVLNGEDGSENLMIPVSTYNVRWGTGPAVGNMDADAELEIVFMTSVPRQLVVIEHDGTEKWVTPLTGTGQGYPALANLDADPEPEVVIGGQWFDNDGTLLQDKGWLAQNGEWSVSAVADISGDGAPDIVGGNVVYHVDGTEVWRNDTAPDGFVAVADVNRDTFPDVISISGGNARVLSGTDGTVIFGPVAIPGGGTGGAPTVADFDGDGRPEFAAAGRGQYAVYDLDCTDTGEAPFCGSGRTDGILWSLAVQDLSSSVTGSSVFDFEGDGEAEVIYNDECTLYILSGKTGEKLLEMANSSRTAAEYPLIVDVDADGNSEFVVPANDDQIVRDGCAVGTHGLFAFGDINDKWVRTRRVWNQHSYHVTNVDASGAIPAVESDSWSGAGLNNYRQNVQGEGVFNAPDLAVVGLSVNTTSCPSSIGIQAQIANTGSLGVGPGVPVGFYLGVPPDGALLGFEMTTVALLPGQSETLVLDFTPENGDTGPWDFYVTVDDEAAGLSVTLECGEENNEGSVGAAGCIVVQ
ncbi:MAG: FG-GAP-like repeat-containing protein [Myxococcales bacterium]|nr:FG-GAP-like repeat-containing protein [Myxococcales bacterium]